MIRRMAASFHMPFETLHQGKRSAWEESRYHPQFINLICYAPFRPAGGGIDTVIYASFGELGSHMNPLGTQGELANSTQKRPIADPGQGMSTDDMEERTHHTVPTVSSAGNKPTSFSL